MPLDFNGDAFTDLLLFPEEPEDKGTIYLLKGKQVGFTNNKINIASQLGLTGSSLGKETRLHVLDYDGDGRSDLLLSKVKAVGTISHTVESGSNGDNTTTITNSLNKLQLEVYRFDPVTERFTFAKKLLDADLREGTYYDLSVMSADSNSLLDILVNYRKVNYTPSGARLVESYQHKTLLLQNRSNSNGVTFSSKSLPVMSFWNTDNIASHKADFNGDGLTDLLLQGTAKTYLAMNTGGNFNRLNLSNGAANHFGLSPSVWKDHHVTLLDYNGDGLSDILLQQGDDGGDRTYLLVATGDPQCMTTQCITVHDNAWTTMHDRRQCMDNA